jgi:hypothetical protein
MRFRASEIPSCRSSIELITSADDGNDRVMLAISLNDVRQPDGMSRASFHGHGLAFGEISLSTTASTSRMGASGQQEMNASQAVEIGADIERAGP